MQLTKNFTLAELTRSDTATRLRINNTPDERATTNLRQSARGLWQPVRDILGVPMRVSSGYRSPTLNRAIGGSTHRHTVTGLRLTLPPQPLATLAKSPAIWW